MLSRFSLSISKIVVLVVLALSAYLGATLVAPQSASAAACDIVANSISQDRITYRFFYASNTGSTDPITLTATIDSNYSCEGSKVTTKNYAKQSNGSYLTTNGSCESVLVTSSLDRGALTNTSNQARSRDCFLFPPTGTVSIDKSSIVNYGYYTALADTVAPLKQKYQAQFNRDISDAWVQMVGGCWAQARTNAASTARAGGTYDVDAGTKDNFATCLAAESDGVLSASEIRQAVQNVSSGSINDQSAGSVEAAEAVVAADKAALEGDPCSGLTSGAGSDAVQWMICPAAQGGAAFIDNFDKMIAGWLRYDTSDLDTLRGVWNNFRNIAIGLLVVVALILIVSQAAGAQVLDAYTIRKAAPRLVIAILFMTLSWPILVFAINLFNDLGGMVQSIILAPIGAGVEDITGGTIINGLLSGGAITLAGVGAIGAGVALGWAGIGSLFLVGALSVLLLAIILALRWVVITACIVFAPIAIIAFILPNTEKIWKIWLSGLIGALATFPIVMAIIALGKASALLILST